MLAPKPVPCYDVYMSYLNDIAAALQNASMTQIAFAVAALFAYSVYRTIKS